MCQVHNLTSLLLEHEAAGLLLPAVVAGGVHHVPHQGGVRDGRADAAGQVRGDAGYQRLSCSFSRSKILAIPLSLHNLVSPISGLPTHLYQAHIY